MWRRIVVVMLIGLGLVGCAQRHSTPSLVAQPESLSGEVRAALALPEGAFSSGDGERGVRSFVGCPLRYALRVMHGDALNHTSTTHYATTLAWEDGGWWVWRGVWWWSDGMTHISWSPLRMLHYHRTHKLHDCAAETPVLPNNANFGVGALFNEREATRTKLWKTRIYREVAFLGHRARWWHLVGFERKQDQEIIARPAGGGPCLFSTSKCTNQRRLDALVAGDGTLLALRQVVDSAVQNDDLGQMRRDWSVHVLHLISACGRPVLPEPPHTSPSDDVPRVIARWLAARPVDAVVRGYVLEHAAWSSSSVNDLGERVSDDGAARFSLYQRVDAEWPDGMRCAWLLQHKGHDLVIADFDCKRGSPPPPP